MGVNSQYCEGSDDPLLPGSPEGELTGKAEMSLQINSARKRKMLTGVLVMLFCLFSSRHVLAAFDLSAQGGATKVEQKLSITDLDPLMQVKTQVARIKSAQPAKKTAENIPVATSGTDCQSVASAGNNNFGNTDDPFQKIDKAEPEISGDLQAVVTDQKVPVEEVGKETDQRREKNYQGIVTGHPIETMVSYIAQCDQETASFLIAIAKKESDWGTYSPKKDGKDCYNYWGYRGSYNLTQSGYSCGRKDQAVDWEKN